MSFGGMWLATRWLEPVARRTDVGRFERGQEYFIEGRVKSIEIYKGKIEATVEGTKLYKVTIEAGPFSTEELKIINEELRKLNKLSNISELTSNDLRRIEKELNDKGLSLLPKTIKYSCTCPDDVKPCKHIMAVMLASGALFIENLENYFKFRDFYKTEDIKEQKISYVSVFEYMITEEDIIEGFEEIREKVIRIFPPLKDEEIDKIMKKLAKKSSEILKTIEQ